MDYLGIPLFSLMKSRLNYDSQRQAVLAQNIANADTPGYRAQDIATPDFPRMLKAMNEGTPGRLTMTLTDPKHMTGAAAQAGAFKMEARKISDELNPDGNNVVIEEEMSKVAANSTDYQQVLGLYGKAIALFKTAIGNTNGG